jgi:hydrogenase nickel incorporation protein HypA/HybF
MHEFSIADALVRQVIRHAPPGRVRSVEIRVGALRGLEPEAMRMCWDAVTFETAIRGAVLEIDQVPWSITCPECARVWTSPVPFTVCACGFDNPRPVGGDELDLVAITTDDEELPT